MATTSRITLVAHTHWDREWYHPFEVFRARLVEVLDEALDVLEKDARLHFTLDGHVALVDDYLEVRPAAEPRIRALVSAGRLHVGPWYTQADTLLTDGESLVRNLAWGIRRADELGGHMRVGYMADQFGHAAQLPQLFRQFGIDAAVLWRGVGPERPPHAFRWIGPDGSEVTAMWLQDGYATGRLVPSDPAGFSSAVERALERHAEWLGPAPLLVPIGDDHVKLAEWLPAAAEALRLKRPDLDIHVGGYADHLPHLREVTHTVRGELRSPAFSPVLAGVASARIREKQAAARATNLLVRYAEPLAAWAQLAGKVPPKDQMARAWRHLLHNHAHDSAAGCGIDETHDDVKARYRWAEQLAGSARDQSLALLRANEAASGHVVAFNAGPSAATVTFEADLPRALEGELIARGTDGVSRPAQILGAVDERPLFEGEFAAAELGVYLQGLDPQTPLFGRYLTGITARPDGAGTVRLDVGLGERPVALEKLAEDQRKVGRMLSEAERFKVVLHAAGTTRRVLLQAGPAPELGWVGVTVQPGKADDGGERAGVLPGERGLFAGPLQVAVDDEGIVTITDPRSGLPPLRANELVDDGDRGDLYHHDLVGDGAPTRARLTRLTVLERGPLRARLLLEQELTLPLGLTADRSARAAATRALPVLTEVTVTAGERRVEFVTRFSNEAEDHRLRALFHVPLRAERLDADQGLAVVARPIDTVALGAGAERPAPTGQHQRFVDISDGAHGAALMSRGLPEHEVTRDGAQTLVALTLVRAVGWLARGDLRCVDHAVGPMIPTPGAQEPGPHKFEYAVMLHQGDWEAGEVMREARQFAAPAIGGAPLAGHALPLGRGLVEVAPRSVVISAAHPASDGRGVVVRVLNAGARAVEATLRPAIKPTEAVTVDPLERPTPLNGATLRDDTVHLSLGPWALATILLR